MPQDNATYRDSILQIPQLSMTNPDFTVYRRFDRIITRR